MPLTRVAGSELSPPRLPRGHDEEGQPHEHPHIDQYRLRLLEKSSRAYFSHVSRICPWEALLAPVLFLLLPVQSTYHLAKKNHSFDALQACCFGSNLKL